LSTPLSTIFQFREKEIEEIIKGLEKYNLVLLSGKAGVGKSRLALECCNNFVKDNPDYQVRCIFNLGPNLFEDLRVYFSNAGKYLILVDDANRLNRFEYVLQILRSRRDDQQIKVIATVRDYALDKIRDIAQSYILRKEVELKPFEEKQIKRLVEVEYEIKNPIYLDRISNIALGNPRLAMMAAHIARRENNLQSISDVSMLYDGYFSSIRKDLDELGGAELVKVAGIIAFLQVIDKSNKEMMDSIELAFGISPAKLWQAVKQLHEHEILDIYENEVARTSDQVLSTYLFYLAFFKQKVLNFSSIINHFFPKFKRRLIDAINPVLSAFGSQTIMDAMCPHVEGYWKKLEIEGKNEELMEFINTFWFLKQTDTLLHLQKCIDEIEAEKLDISEMDFKASSSSSYVSILKVLERFQDSDEDNFRIALNLIFNFVSKRPSSIPSVLHMLTQDFGLKYDSYRYGFLIQRILLNQLWKRAKSGDDEIFSRLFIATASDFVKIHHHNVEFRGGNTFTTYDFELPSSPEILELRKELWECLFSLYAKPNLQTHVLGVFQSYGSDFYRLSEKEIIEQDANQILPFVKESLQPDDYMHCILVNAYLDLLDMKEVTYEQDLREKFSSETYIVSELLLSDSFARRTLKMNYEEYEQYRKERIIKHSASYTLSDYKRFFGHVVEIQKHIEEAKWVQLHMSVELMFADLSSRDFGLFVEVLETYLELGEPLRLHWVLTIVCQLIQNLGIETSLTVIDKYDYPTKKAWLFAVYRMIQQDKIEPIHLEQLYDLYRVAQPEDIPQDFSYLLNYKMIDEKVLSKVVKILIEKMQANPRFAYSLSTLFNGYAEISKSLVDLFRDEIDVLEYAYLGILETNRHEDYKGDILTQILDIDPSFITKYLEQFYKKHEGVKSRSFGDSNRNYSFLWLRNDYKTVMNDVAEFIYTKERETFGFWFTYLRAFFSLHEGNKENALIEERQNDFLLSLIEKCCSDVGFIDYVFAVVSEMLPNRRKQFIEKFLLCNQNIEDFMRLELEPNHWSYSGSMVPVLQNRIEFFESLLPLLNTINFLAHKQYIERKIYGLRLQIEREKKEDFMRD
jgi:hypothetical protein